MHHQRIGRRALQPFHRQAVKVVIFARRGDELPFHPFGLKTQHHGNVRTVQRSIEIVKWQCAHRLDFSGHQRGRRAQADIRAQCGQAQDVGPRDTAVQDIAANRHRQSGEIIGVMPPLAQGMAQGKRIQQRLCRMFVLAVAGIENRAIDLARDQFHRTARSVPDHNRIRAHRVERDRRIDQRFALLHARLRSVHVDHVSAKPLACNFKAQQRAGGIFKERVDDRQAGQQIAVFARLPVQVDPLFGLVEEVQDLVAFQLANAQQVAVRIGQRTRRIFPGKSSRSLRRSRRCH